MSPPHGDVLGDPVTWAIAADQIIAERRRAARLSRFTASIRISDPATSPQILAQFGLSRESAAARTRLLARARRGDQAARQRLRQLYGVTVWQRPEVQAATVARAREAAAR